jgi:hypothetical protein
LKRTETQREREENRRTELPEPMNGGGRTELSRRSSRKRGFLDSFAYDYGGPLISQVGWWPVVSSPWVGLATIRINK